MVCGSSGGTGGVFSRRVAACEGRGRWFTRGDSHVGLVLSRSALFLPFPDLGLIVVDEEHDASFKQEEGVIYHARDMAVARARFESALIVLASATPSLETVTNAATGRYGRYHLPDRYGAAGLAAIEAGLQ